MNALARGCLAAAAVFAVIGLTSWGSMRAVWAAVGAAAMVVLAGAARQAG
jgi:hypothetical protein